MKLVKPDMAALLPVGKFGTAAIEHFVIGEKEAAWARMREAATGGREQAVMTGTYAKLLINGRLVMSDTQMEWDTCREAVQDASGDVLVGGLGLGMVVFALTQNPKVRSITVIEINPDVIRLVAPHMPENVRVVQGDIRKWKPPMASRWDYVWLDIWPDICADNLSEMNKLRKRYIKFMRSVSDYPHDTIRCWSEDVIEEYS